MSGHQTLSVVKIGGGVLEDPNKKASFLKAFTQLSGHKVLVHGGGRSATEIGELLGVKSEMVEGRRVTDEKTLEVVTMVYGGLVNKRLVAELQALGINALGLTGADGNLILAGKRPITNGVDYGYVGDPKSINTPLLVNLIHSDILPVIAPLTHDGAGHLLNTNADTIASTVAVGLAQDFHVNLITTFELDGVLLDVNNPESLIRSMNEVYFGELKVSGKIHSGMIPKLENAFKAIKDGVKAVRICKFDQINTDHGSILQI